MRPSQTVVRVLLIASVANSALAASSSPAPEEEEIHNVKRAKLPKLPADFNENAKNLLKTTGTVGAIAGLFSGLGSAFQRLIIAPGGSSSTTSNATARAFAMPSLGARTPLPIEDPDASPSLSRALSDLSDKDLQLLSILSRRVIEMLD